MSFIVRVLQEHFDEAHAAMHDAIQEALQPACDALIGHFQSNVPVDTSSLQQGFYTVSKQNDTYSDAVSQAEAVNPSVKILDECDPPDDDTHAHVSNVTEHSLYIEFGTAKMPAQPFFFSTVDMVRDEIIGMFEDAIVQAIKHF